MTLSGSAESAGTQTMHSSAMATARQVASTAMARLVRTVEAEIVPRLLLSRRSAAQETPLRNVDDLDAGDAAELARLLLVYEVDVPYAYVESIRHRGVSVQHICLHLLAPAARRLGLLWDRDECDFMQVTLGLGRLQQLLHRLSLLPGERVTPAPAGPERRALLAPLPGEHHAFGILMVTQFFRNNGWEVWNEFPQTTAELIAYVRQHSFALVGLSVATQANAKTLSKTIRQLRRASLNPSVCVMVGGPLLVEHPELATRVGADATAPDAREAALRANRACALLAADGK